jgi:hypothetical protein
MPAFYFQNRFRDRFLAKAWRFHAALETSPVQRIVSVNLGGFIEMLA